MQTHFGEARALSPSSSPRHVFEDVLVLTSSKVLPREDPLRTRTMEIVT